MSVCLPVIFYLCVYLSMCIYTYPAFFFTFFFASSLGLPSPPLHIHTRTYTFFYKEFSPLRAQESSFPPAPQLWASNRPLFPSTLLASSLTSLPVSPREYPFCATKQPCNTTHPTTHQPREVKAGHFFPSSRQRGKGRKGTKGRAGRGGVWERSGHVWVGLNTFLSPGK